MRVLMNSIMKSRFPIRYCVCVWVVVCVFRLVSINQLIKHKRSPEDP